MISDIPICTFMSGGLDSSLVSAISSEFLKEDGMELTTYSFDFVDNETNFVPNDFQSTKDRPFVDIMKEHIKSKHIYLEYVYNLPEDYKYHDGIVKSLLVDVGKDYLPTDVLHRKKSPYPKTYDKNYEKLLICRLQDVCSDPNSPLLDFVDINKLKYFMNSPMDYGKPWYGQLMAGPQMLGYLLQIDYWLRKCPY